MKVGGKVGKIFWTTRRVRQGYPLSPLLFNVLLADVEEVFGKVKWGRVRIGERRYCYTLGYADDMVLMAEGEDELRSMIGRFEEYLDGKRLKMNVKKKKTKIMRFRKGG